MRTRGGQANTGTGMNAGGLGMRPLRFVAVIGVAYAALLPVRQAHAWGPDAHRTIALIADKVLQQSDAAARGKVQALLATDKDSRLTKNDIASEATWADVLRDKSQEARIASSNWHAVRLRADSPELAAACYGRPPLPSGYPASRGPRNNCVIDKIEQFQKELQNTETAPRQQPRAARRPLTKASRRGAARWLFTGSVPITRPKPWRRSSSSSPRAGSVSPSCCATASNSRHPAAHAPPMRVLVVYAHPLS